MFFLASLYDEISTVNKSDIKQNKSIALPIPVTFLSNPTVQLIYVFQYHLRLSECDKISVCMVNEFFLPGFAGLDNAAKKACF